MGRLLPAGSGASELGVDQALAGHQQPLLFSPSMADQRRVPAVRRSRLGSSPETRGIAGSDTSVDVTGSNRGLLGSR